MTDQPKVQPAFFNTSHSAARRAEISSRLAAPKTPPPTPPLQRIAEAEAALQAAHEAWLLQLGGASAAAVQSPPLPESQRHLLERRLFAPASFEPESDSSSDTRSAALPTSLADKLTARLGGEPITEDTK